MTTVVKGNDQTFLLPIGKQLTVVAATGASGIITRLADVPGGEPGVNTPITTGQTLTFGPFATAARYLVTTALGSIDVSSALPDPGLGALETEVAGVIQAAAAAAAGTAATGVTATEAGDAVNHLTTLVVDTVLPAIAGGADLAVGALAYTFPAGRIVIHASSMSLAIQQTEDNITADTPDLGIGTTIGSGVQAVLSGVGAAAENIMTGQTMNDCDGTAELKTVGTQLVIEAADNHTVYINVADGWAADGDIAAGLAGSVVIAWSLLG